MKLRDLSTCSSKQRQSDRLPSQGDVTPQRRMRRWAHGNPSAFKMTDHPNRGSKLPGSTQTYGFDQVNGWTNLSLGPSHGPYEPHPSSISTSSTSSSPGSSPSSHLTPGSIISFDPLMARRTSVDHTATELFAASDHIDNYESSFPPDAGPRRDGPSTFGNGHDVAAPDSYSAQQYPSSLGCLRSPDTVAAFASVVFSEGAQSTDGSSCPLSQDNLSDDRATFESGTPFDFAPQVLHRIYPRDTNLPQPDHLRQMPSLPQHPLAFPRSRPT